MSLDDMWVDLAAVEPITVLAGSMAHVARDIPAAWTLPCVMLFPSDEHLLLVWRAWTHYDRTVMSTRDMEGCSLGRGMRLLVDESTCARTRTVSFVLLNPWADRRTITGITLALPHPASAWVRGLSAGDTKSG